MKKITLGRYPSSIKADEVNITKQLKENIYIGDDGETYEKLYDRYYRIEPIIWRVAEQNENEALLLCDRSLDIRNYDDNFSDYEHSAIRKWLNGEFFNGAFNGGEQKQIVISTVDNHTQCYEKGFIEWEYQNTGEDTRDRVFLLSVTEAFEILKTPQERKLGITDYALGRLNGMREKSKLLAKKLWVRGCYPWQMRTTYISRDSGGAVSMFRQAGTHTGMAKCLIGIEKNSDQIFGVAPAVRIKDPALLPN